MMSGKCEPGSCGLHCWCKIIARVLLALVFLYAGYHKLIDISGTAGYIASVGLPYAKMLAWVAGLVELIAGVLLVVGYFKRYAAYALIIFSIISTYFFHLKAAMAGDATQTIEVLKNLAIIGGLFLVSGCGECGSCGSCGNGTCGTCDAHTKEGEGKCEECKTNNK